MSVVAPERSRPSMRRERIGFFAYGPAFTGAGFVAGTDLHPAPGGELVTGAGAGGGLPLRGFSPGGATTTSFMAY